ncbi:MAG: hypothetical protein NC548_60330 [Lachnospiraceae bacterium]|nr:hypothetical protein [Lachnospiraceae bacterium]
MNIKKAEDIKCMVNRAMHTPIKVVTPDMKVHTVSASCSAAGDNHLQFELDNFEIYNYEDLICYDPMYDGAVTAVRIYLKDHYKPMADLAFAYGGTFTFEWDRCDIREMFMPGITAYTLMYDTRCSRPFTDWIKPKEGENT